MNNNELRAWETLEKRTIVTFGRFLTVESHTVKLPEGQVIHDWPWLIVPSAAIVLPVTEDGKFLCFRQTKYALEGTSLAPVGGLLEPDETPLDGARRELLEEMGCESPDWATLGSYVLDPNRGMATMHLFLAMNARQVAEPNNDDLEDQQLLVLSRNEVQRALEGGEFKVLAWAAVVAMSLDYLDARQKGKAGSRSSDSR